MPTGWTPPRTQQMVNDYTGTLSRHEQQALELRLRACEDSSGVQILLLLVPDLGGNDIAGFAQQVWDEWKVGDSKLNNGVMLLIKPKNQSDGQLRIQTGYGMEGALPDAFCKRIIDDKMIPYLQEGNYYRAINEALDVIIPIACGEYSMEQYQKDENRETLIGIGLFFVFILIVFLISRRHGNRHGGNGTHSGMGGIPYFGPSWGGGSFGGGSFGGFGGWGGGSSGGGGASGRW